jgi:hypothetical protein
MKITSFALLLAAAMACGANLFAQNVKADVDKTAKDTAEATKTAARKTVRATKDATSKTQDAAADATHKTIQATK